jgi:hypothetical protein
VTSNSKSASHTGGKPAHSTPAPMIRERKVAGGRDNGRLHGLLTAAWLARVEAGRCAPRPNGHVWLKTKLRGHARLSGIGIWGSSAGSPEAQSGQAWPRISRL